MLWVIFKYYILTASNLSSTSTSLLGLLSFLILKAYINDPAATVVDRKIPVNKIKANKPPIKPPFNLKRFDLSKRTNNIKIVVLRVEIFKKVIGDKGLINIEYVKLHIP